MKEIQWYPGHMTKARRMLQDMLKQIDVVLELVDARAPIASRNPDFDTLFSQKQRVLILNKADLADPVMTKQFEGMASGSYQAVLPFVATRRGGKKEALTAIEKAAAPIVERSAAKGVKKTVRVLIAGIPNVGKSTLINTLSGSGNAVTGNRPGVTRGKQWVRLGPYLELMDSPGLLWPKLENRQNALHLAYIGAIRDEILDTEELAISLLRVLLARYPKETLARYPQLNIDEEHGENLLGSICRSRGFLLGGAEPDYARAARTVLDEFRAGIIGRFTLDELGQI